MLVPVIAAGEGFGGVRIVGAMDFCDLYNCLVFLACPVLGIKIPVPA